MQARVQRVTGKYPHGGSYCCTCIKETPLGCLWWPCGSIEEEEVGRLLKEGSRLRGQTHNLCHDEHVNLAREVLWQQARCRTGLFPPWLFSTNHIVFVDQPWQRRQPTNWLISRNGSAVLEIWLVYYSVWLAEGSAICHSYFVGAFSYFTMSSFPYGSLIYRCMNIPSGQSGCAHSWQKGCHLPGSPALAFIFHLLNLHQLDTYLLSYLHFAAA